MVSSKGPGVKFSQKVPIERPGLSQVLRASGHENHGNLYCLEKVSIKRPVL